MATNNHELAQSIAEAVMKQFSNFKSEFNTETIAPSVYEFLLGESVNVTGKPDSEWNHTPEFLVNERVNQYDLCWDTDDILNLLTLFIAKNTSQKDFVKYVDARVKEDIATLARCSEAE